MPKTTQTPASVLKPTKGKPQGKSVKEEALSEKRKKAAKVPGAKPASRKPAKSGKT